MQNRVKVLGAMMLSAALFFGSVGTGALSTPVAKAADQVKRDYVSVSGTGTVEVEPDIAYVSLGVVSRGKTAAEAQTQNAAAFDKVKKLLSDTFKIQDKDIKTVDFSVQPQYQYKENTEPKIVAYEANHMVVVNVRDLTKVGKLVDEASKAGANRINNIRFDVENKENSEAQALEKAVANARKKAEAIAKASGRQLGIVISVTEGGSSYNPIYMNEPLMAKDMASAESAPQAGQVKLSESVQVEFELK